jgi:hypothetical protein
MVDIAAAMCLPTFSLCHIQQQQQQGAAAAPATYGPITFYLYNGLRPPGEAEHGQMGCCIMATTCPVQLFFIFFFPLPFQGAHQHAEVRVTPFDVFPFGGAPAREVSREEQERENVNLARRIKVRRAGHFAQHSCASVCSSYY